MRRWHGNPWAILATVCLGFFMTLLDVTIVNIAIPSMIDSLGASLDEILWVINAYVIMLAVFVITAGRLGDRYGQRIMFVVGVVVFTAASLACGLSQGPAALIAFRAVQGLGAAILMPQTSALLVITFPPDKRGTAFGIWGGVAGIATLAGPTLGGFLVTVFDWPWIFFINVPIGGLVITMALTIIPDRVRRDGHRLDPVGVVLASLALVCLTFGLVEGERFGWGAVWGAVTIPRILLVGGMFLVAFVAYQARRQHDEPLVPFVLFRDRTYAQMNIVSMSVSLAMVGVFFPLVIYLQSVLGFSALQAGLLVAPMSLMSMITAPFAGRWADRTGGRRILAGGLASFATGITVVVALADTDTPWWHFTAPLALAGVGLGCTFAPMNTMAMRKVPPSLAGAASGVLNTTRQFGGVLGSAVVGAVLQNRLVVTLRAEAVARSDQIPAEYRQEFVDAFGDIARGGLEVGAGQSGVDSSTLPSGVPDDVARVIGDVAHDVFNHGYVGAMPAALGVPIGAVLVSIVVISVGGRRTTDRPAL